MRDPKRIFPLSAKLANLWYSMPDRRLGQLIEYLAKLDRFGKELNVFEMEDEVLEKRIEQWTRTNKETQDDND